MRVSPKSQRLRPPVTSTPDGSLGRVSQGDHLAASLKPTEQAGSLR